MASTSAVVVVLLMVAVPLCHCYPATDFSVNGHQIVIDEEEAAEKSGEVKDDCSSIPRPVEDQNTNDRPHTEKIYTPDHALKKEGSKEKIRIVSFTTDSESKNTVLQKIQEGTTDRMTVEDLTNGIPSEHQRAQTYKLDGCANDVLSLSSPVREDHSAICGEFRYGECNILDSISFESRGESRFDTRRVNVTLSRGRLYGLRVFSAKYTISEGSLMLVLKWRTLRMFFELKTDEGGLERTMDVEVRLPLTRVFAHKWDHKAARVEIQLVDDLVFHLTADPFAASDMAETTWIDVQSRIRGFIHEKLWYFMHSRVKQALEGGTDEHLTPFCM